MVRGILDDVLKRPRTLDYKSKSKDPPFPVLWVQTFGTATDQIQKTIANANDVAKLSHVWKGVEKVIGLVNRRNRNMGDLILKRKHFALEETTVSTSGTTRCTPVVGPGKKRANPGRPCESCTMMSKKKSIESTVTGSSYKIPSANYCKSKNLVYCAECLLCQKQ